MAWPWPRKQAPKVERSRSASPRFSVDVPPEIVGGMTAGGAIAPRVARNEALQVPAVLRSRNLICSTLAGLPLRTHAPDRSTVEGYLLGGNIDPDLANIVVLAATYEDLLFEGVAWWRITRFGWHGYPVEAMHVPPGAVHVAQTGSLLPSQAMITPDQSIPPTGQVYVDGLPIPDDQIIRFDSPNPPLLRHAARAIRTCLKLDRTAAMYADQPTPLGLLSAAPEAADLTDDEVQKMLDDWNDSINKGAWAYIEGVTPTPLQWDAEKIQLADQRQHAVLEIARAAGVDPEDLGVSTTSRTYQNGEQRRLDLLDFTLQAYVGAVEQRLSMRDVLPRGYQAKVSLDGFLRSDTMTRYQSYKLGLEVGALVQPEIRELEDRPALPATQSVAAGGTSTRQLQLVEQIQKIYLGVGKVITTAEAREILNRSGAGLDVDAPVPGAPGATPAGPETEDAMEPASLRPVANFAAEGTTTLTFDDAEVAASFRVNVDKRTISGIAVPYGKVARSGFARWKFTRDSLHWVDLGRVKLNMFHDHDRPVGRAVRLDPTDAGLDVTFKLGRGPDADRALEDAEDGITDGFSIEVTFDDDGDGWEPDPADESVRLVRRAKLRGVALTAMPAFDDARVDAVAASMDNQKGASMPDVKADGESPPADTTTFDTAMTALADKVVKSHEDLTKQLGESIGESVSAGFKAALEALPGPQDGRQSVRASHYAVTREAPIYTFSGSAAAYSLVRDAWYAGMEDDQSAQDRLRKYRAQQDEMAKLAATQSTQFATVTTGTASQIIPPGYRPDLYVAQLFRERPLVAAASQGTISDATPFTVPTFTSSSGATADHVEGVNPTDGTVSFGTKTVTPGGISGRLVLTREIVDSSNPTIDQIALQTMRESYSQQTETKVYTLLNGANGAGGTITSGFVPSGAQAATFVGTTGTPPALIAGIRSRLAAYSFNRFAAPSVAVMGQNATTILATAVDTTGRPVFPSVGAQNTAGVGNSVQQTWFVDGLPFVPAWAMTGVAAGDTQIAIVNSSDLWVWESPTLTFKFLEKSGPAMIELALFGYFATHLLRPVGLSGIRIT